MDALHIFIVTSSVLSVFDDNHMEGLLCDIITAHDCSLIVLFKYFLFVLSLSPRLFDDDSFAKCRLGDVITASNIGKKKQRLVAT